MAARGGTLRFGRPPRLPPRPHEDALRSTPSSSHQEGPTALSFSKAMASSSNPGKALEDFPPLQSNPPRRRSRSTSRPRIDPTKVSSIPKAWNDLFTSKISPNENLSLEFISPSFDQDSSMKVAVIEDEETSDLERFWSSSLSGYIVGLRPAFLPLKKFMLQFWNIKGGFQLFMREGGHFVCHFDLEDDLLRVLEGYWTIRGHPMILRRWSKDATFERETLTNLPIWITIPNLPLHLWSQKPLSRICSVIGNPLYMDRLTATRQRLQFAKMCVEVNINSELPDYVFYRMGNGDLVQLKIEYQWKPKTCDSCGHFGHPNNACKKSSPPPGNRLRKKKGKQEEVPQELEENVLAQQSSSGSQLAAGLTELQTRLADSGGDSGGDPVRELQTQEVTRSVGNSVGPTELIPTASVNESSQKHRIQSLNLEELAVKELTTFQESLNSSQCNTELAVKDHSFDRGELTKSQENLNSSQCNTKREIQNSNRFDDLDSVAMEREIQNETNMETLPMQEKDLNSLNQSSLPSEEDFLTELTAEIGSPANIEVDQPHVEESPAESSPKAASPKGMTSSEDGSDKEAPVPSQSMAIVASPAAANMDAINASPTTKEEFLEELKKNPLKAPCHKDPAMVKAFKRLAIVQHPKFKASGGILPDDTELDDLFFEDDVTEDDKAITKTKQKGNGKRRSNRRRH